MIAPCPINITDPPPIPDAIDEACTLQPCTEWDTCWNGEEGAGDWVIEDGQFASRNPIETAIIKALFTWGDAREGDVVPGENNQDRIGRLIARRRGWVLQNLGNGFQSRQSNRRLYGQSVTFDGPEFGFGREIREGGTANASSFVETMAYVSRLWLLDGRPDNLDTRLLLKNLVSQALNPLVQAGLFARFAVQAGDPTKNQLSFSLQAFEPSGFTAADLMFTAAWAKSCDDLAGRVT